MKPTRVRAAGLKTGKAVFDQAAAGIVNGQAARGIVRANGKVVVLDGGLKVVKEAIERGDLISLEPVEVRAEAAVEKKPA